MVACAGYVVGVYIEVHTCFLCLIDGGEQSCIEVVEAVVVLIAIGSAAVQGEEYGEAIDGGSVCDNGFGIRLMEDVFGFALNRLDGECIAHYDGVCLRLGSSFFRDDHGRCGRGNNGWLLVLRNDDTGGNEKNLV